MPIFCRDTLEAVRLLQRQRERARGLTADANITSAPQPPDSAGRPSRAAKSEVEDATGDGEGGEELALQDTFAQETAVIAEDPNMWVQRRVLVLQGISISPLLFARPTLSSD